MERAARGTGGTAVPGPSGHSTPPELVREFRDRLGVAIEELADLLSLDAARLAAYERSGGPAWLGYALAGLALSTFETPDDEVRHPAWPSGAEMRDAWR